MSVSGMLVLVSFTAPSLIKAETRALLKACLSLGLPEVRGPASRIGSGMVSVLDSGCRCVVPRIW